MKDIEKKYNHIDHTHCWISGNPPCGQKIKHFKCCLCEMTNPEITDIIDQTLETQALALEERKHTGAHTHRANGVCRVCSDNEIWQQAADHLRAQKITKQEYERTHNQRNQSPCC